jgi:membrane peptidoglycan carboxypeptidase
LLGYRDGYSGYAYIAGEIWAALCTNIGAKKIVYGASTITMQLAKNLYFRFTHSFLRKAAEIIIALALERKLGKERILELYINIIYFGNGVYGISDAARFYFSKPVADLSLNQMFMLACMPSAPTIIHPGVPVGS